MCSLLAELLRTMPSALAAAKGEGYILLLYRALE